MVGRGAWLLVLGSATACNTLFGVDELRFDNGTGGGGGHASSSSVTSSSVAQTATGSGGGGGAGGGGGGAACGYAAAVLADMPVGYFRLGEANGASVVDEVSTIDGMYVGGVVLGQAGALGCDPDTAVTFDGVTGEANLGDRFEFALGTSFTIEAWVNIAIVDGVFRPIISKEFMGTNGRQGYFLWVHETAGLGFELVTNSDPDVVQLLTVPTGEWLHVVGTYDGVETCLHVNGSLHACELIEAELEPHPGLFKLGSFSLGIGDFAGSIDEVAIYDSALDANRIQAHFNASAR